MMENIIGLICCAVAGGFIGFRVTTGLVLLCIGLHLIGVHVAGLF